MRLPHKDFFGREPERIWPGYLVEATEMPAESVLLQGGHPVSPLVPFAGLAAFGC